MCIKYFNSILDINTKFVIFNHVKPLWAIALYEITCFFVKFAICGVFSCYKSLFVVCKWANSHLNINIHWNVLILTRLLNIVAILRLKHTFFNDKNVCVFKDRYFFVFSCYKLLICDFQWENLYLNIWNYRNPLITIGFV